MTLDETMEVAARKLDALIDERLAGIEARIRADLAATGPEDEDALDRPPVPGATWQRITVEELMLREREQLETWRAETLAMIRHNLEHVDAL